MRVLSPSLVVAVSVTTRAVSGSCTSGATDVTSNMPQQDLVYDTTEKVTSMDTTSARDSHACRVFYNIDQRFRTYKPGTAQILPSLVESVDKQTRRYKPVAPTAYFSNLYGSQLESSPSSVRHRQVNRGFFPRAV